MSNINIIQHQLGRFKDTVQSGINSFQAAVQQQHGSSNFYPTTLDIQQSAKSGWLRKQGGVVKSWHRRWFTIKGDYMYYYSTPDEFKAPLGVIFLPGNSIVEHPFNANETEKFMFEIVPCGDKSKVNATHETQPLSAESEEDRKEWVKAIKQILYGSVGGAIFGRSLEETLKYEMVRDINRKVPEIVEVCIEYLLKNGLKEEGIFRLPGRSNLIKQMCDTFDRGERPQIDVPEMDVHTAASLLKCYLRDLPGPLIPFEFYESVISIVTREMPASEERALEKLRTLLRTIPVASYNVMQYLCRFLNEVACNANVNKMTYVNLATVFVNAFILPEDDDPALLMGTASSRTMATLVLMKHHEMLFSSEYTVSGTSVEVDDLLKLEADDEMTSFTDMVLGSLQINNDLVGLDFGPFTQPTLKNNGSQPVCDSQEAVRARSSSVPVSKAPPTTERVALRRSVMNNASAVHDVLGRRQSEKRGAMIYHENSENQLSDSSKTSPEAKPPTAQPTAPPTAPPRVKMREQTSIDQSKDLPPPISQKSALLNPVALDLATLRCSAATSDDSAIDALTTLDISHFTMSDMTAHVERLGMELKVRQTIIDDLNNRLQTLSKTHHRQIDTFIKKMEASRTQLSRFEQIEKELQLYKDKYGPLS